MGKFRWFGVVIALIPLLGVAGFIYWKYGRAGTSVPPLVYDSKKTTTPTPPSDSPEKPAENPSDDLSFLTIPEGFSISVYARDLGKPRVLLADPWGGFLVSIPASGTVLSLRDSSIGEYANTKSVVLENLNRPHGLTFGPCVHPGFGTGFCTLYVAESDTVSQYLYNGKSATKRKKLFDLPDGGNHFTRTILIDPKDRNTLLISVGSSCNVCNETDSRRAKILAGNLKTGELTEYARGLRNSVFMTTHPVTGAVWATEMGRDLLGDNIPPDEINIVQKGANFGWPICYGKNIVDKNFHKQDHQHVRPDCTEPFEVPSHVDIPAHSAPLGLAFIPEEGWPEAYWHDLLVSYHGSWNRSVATGYKIVRVRLNGKGIVEGIDDFITGWFNDGRVRGRPVDVLVQPDGTVYVTDDEVGVIYRVAKKTKQPDREISDLIRVSTPTVNALVVNPLRVTGEARGTWYFEGDFPVRLFDGTGRELGRGIASAKGEWMTESFVPFEATVLFSKPGAPDGTVVLERNNPSDLPENDREIRVPVRFNIKPR